MSIPKWLKYKKEMRQMDSLLHLLEKKSSTPPTTTPTPTPSPQTPAVVKWDDIQDKPKTFMPVIGETATTAKAGNAPGGSSALEINAAVKAKTQIAALTPLNTSAPLDLLGAINQITALKAQINAIIAALKA